MAVGMFCGCGWKDAFSSTRIESFARYHHWHWLEHVRVPSSREVTVVLVSLLYNNGTVVMMVVVPEELEQP
jgi:hypothetical protein